MATQALAMLLEDRLLRDALVRYLGEVTETDLSAVRWFEAERVHEDLARPDLEGIDDRGRPVVVVEAKFDARLSTGQVRSYLNDQERRLGGEAGAFVLLVPASRFDYAGRVLEAALRERGDEGHAPYLIAAAVLTWDSWLEAWNDAVRHLPATPDSLAADLVQLRELVVTMGGLVIPPLDGAAAGEGWREREPDLRIIVDQVTTRLSDPSSRRPPIVHEVGYDPLRYAPGGYSEPGSSCSVGLASRFADQGATPLWLESAKLTPHFADIRARIMTSTFADDVLTDDGHLWLPLALPGDLAGPELVDHLVAEVRRGAGCAGAAWMVGTRVTNPTTLFARHVRRLWWRRHS